MGASRTVRCPGCEYIFELSPDVAKGNLTFCPKCYIDLEVISLAPALVQRIRDFLAEESTEEDGIDDPEDFDE